MGYCDVCEKDTPSKELNICEGCKEKVCIDCCVEMTYHNMIDFPYCKRCQSLNEILD